MRVRDFFAHLSAVAMLAGVTLVVMAGEAAAQFLPPPYSYPQGGYRGVPGPDGTITVDPDDDERIERPIPPRRGPYQYSNPYDPRERDGAPYPIDPRINREPPPPPSAGPGPAPAPNPDRDIVRRLPWYGPMPPYEERGSPPGVSTARPDDLQQPGLRPPAVIESRPPGVIESRPPTSLSPPSAATPGRPTNLASLPAEDQPEEDPKELPPQFKRQVIPYQTKEPAGTIIIDTPSTYLYYVNGDGTAIRYGIGVGREGFTWAGTEKISRMAEWPDWHPPAEMIERQPYLPRFMAGGPGNPLGARALYLGKTVYRIHGTNQPSTIGQFVSSGCIRMLNEDVEDLYGRVKQGTKVVVLASRSPAAANIPPAR